MRYYALIGLPEGIIRLTMKYKVYPPPKQLRMYKRQLDLRRTQVRVLCEPSAPLTEALLRFCAANQLQLTFGQPDPDRVALEIDRKRGPSESYELVARDKVIFLRAPDDAGLFYGLGTLQQVLRQATSPGQTQMPAFSIVDEPDFEHRGVMLDISRNKVPTMSTLFALVDQFASLKLNQLQLYVEHTFAFTNHRTVWSDASPLTAEQVLQLAQYCRSRFIELVPNLNSFGHFERWLRHPEYRSYAECPDGYVHPLSGHTTSFGSTLKPNGKSLRLLKELYDEYLPLFTGSHFNVGGDEPWELGHGFSRRRCQREGTANVYVAFIAKITAQVARRGRRTMFWSDIVLKHPGSIRTLPGDVIAMNWGYEANHPFRTECQQIADHDIPFYVCPGTSSWNSLTGRLANATGNLANAARQGLDCGAVGYLITDWGDGGHHQYLPISYPGFVIGACHAWHHRASRSVDVTDAIDRIFESPGASTAAITALGNLPELVPSSMRNATIFNRLLFWDMTTEPGEAKPITDSQLSTCTGRINEIREELGPRAGDQLTDELINAAAMAQHGLDRLGLFRGYHRRTARLKRDISRIIDRHDALWLARNRSGGLPESAAYLHRSAHALSP